jgi:hypothetical protein
MDEHFWKEVELARKMTPDERVREGFRLFEQGCDYIVRSIEANFPEMHPNEVRRVRDRVIRQCKFWGVL